MFTAYLSYSPIVNYFFFNDTATTEIYTLSLHDALPISITVPIAHRGVAHDEQSGNLRICRLLIDGHIALLRSEEHTSELQSHVNLVCRLLLEKKKELLFLPDHARLHNRRDHARVICYAI